jgi:hypothetical protein
MDDMPITEALAHVLEAALRDLDIDPGLGRCDALAVALQKTRELRDTLLRASI